MRGQTKIFIENFLSSHKISEGRVLDVGSLDVSGTFRDVFSGDGWDYTGVDMRDGDNVDVVMNGHDLSKNYGEEFDLVCYFDTMEHDDAFWLTVEEIKKVLKPGGYLLMGGPGPNCPRHDHPNDYWRFYDSSFHALLFDMDDIYVEEQTDNPSHSFHDEVYGYGRKR